MLEQRRIQTVIRLGGSLLILAGITFFYRRVITDVNSTTVALSFLLAILGVATAWGLFEAIVSSVAGMLCFNFFFLPPVGTFTIADPQNWVALFAFLVTAVVASNLSASVKRRAQEATRRQQEVERLYELSRGLMLLDKQSPMAEEIGYRIAQVFRITGVAVYDHAKDRVYRTDPANPSISEAKLRDTALQGTVFHDSLSKLSVLPLSLGGKPIGSLAILGGGISDTAVNAIGNLAAIAMERARVEEAASRMEAVRQNEEMKSMLLDALAHEFKTPLTSIKVAASSILDEERGLYRELATIIDEEADRLNSLVNETIWMARIEAGDLHLHKSPYSAADIVSRSLEKLRILLKDREIDIEVAPTLPGVLVDAELVGLTLRQLVTNALKYSNPESPITIRAVPQDAVVKISVKDCGPGIPKAELQRIFERYYRVKHEDGVPGTGMGLAIARNIILAHGGEIWVDSSPEQGSEFSFTLPIARSSGGPQIS